MRQAATRNPLDHPRPRRGQAGFWVLHQLRQGLSGANLRKALGDIWGGLQRVELWSTMGMQEIGDRYRRSIIGPFWLTISLGVMVFGLGLLYAGIFRQPVGDYLPYVAGGFTVWGLISGMVLDGSRGFIDAEPLIRQLPAPLSLHIYRVVWTNFMVFGHNIWVFIAVALLFGVPVGWATLAVIPGLILLLLNGVWIGLLLGLISARFRDVPQIIASITQLAFFMTPIIWKPDMLAGREFVLDANPFYHLLEVVRGPLLGQALALEQWLTVGLITLGGWSVTLVFFAVYRWRIAYWV
jgi:ABC-2 type transport system permease protein/lipopolysaccharide transport system permease protein